jgi:hypothetical protein
MKKQIVLGSIIAVLLVVLVPAIPAVEVTSSLEVQKTQLIKEIENMDAQDVVRYLQTVSGEEIQCQWQTVDHAEITDAFASLGISDAIKDIEEQLTQGNAQPQCILLTLLLFKLFWRFVGFVIGLIAGTIGRAIGLFFRIVGTMIGFIFGMIGRIIGLVFGTLGLIVGILGRIIGLFGRILGFILNIIFPGTIYSATV